jgi:hypothetical protein
MKRYLLLVLFFMSLQFGLQAQHRSVGYRWEKDSVSVALIKQPAEGREFALWQLNLDPRLKPFFHPVSSPDGTLLTAEAPPDHPWHLGLWFCWKYINKLNYWEFTGDPKMAVSEGRTDVKQIRIDTRRNGSAVIRLQIDYHPWTEPSNVVMTESRTITVSTPDKSGSYSIYFDMAFEARQDLVLDRTPPQINAAGVKWGGYAGLSMRFDTKLSDPDYFSELSDSVSSGENHPFVAANLKTPAGKTVQAVIFDHPDNPRHPSAWYTINRPNDRFWFFTPALLYNSAMEMKKGEKMRLRYRVLIPSLNAMISRKCG